MNVVDVRSNTSPSELRLKKAAFGVELVFKASPPCAANSIVEARQLLDTDRLSCMHLASRDSNLGAHFRTRHLCHREAR